MVLERMRVASRLVSNPRVAPGTAPGSISNGVPIKGVVVRSHRIRVVTRSIEIQLTSRGTVKQTGSAGRFFNPPSSHFILIRH